MRVKVAIISGALLVLTAGTGAAYAVVGHTSVSPTVTGNTLPIDDNHSSAAHPSVGDDRAPRPTRLARSTSLASATAAAASSSDDRGRGHDAPGHH